MMLSKTIELTEVSNVYTDASGYKNYYGGNVVQFIPVSATRAIIVHAQIGGSVNGTVTPYVTSKVYYNLVDFSGSDPVIVTTYINQDSVLASMNTEPYDHGSFVLTNGDIVSALGFQVSDMLNTLPPTDDGVATSNQRGYVALITKIQVSGNTIVPVYSTSITHSASSSGTGWTNGSGFLFYRDDNTATRVANRGGFNYTDTINLSTGLPVGGSYLLGGFGGTSYTTRVGENLYYFYASSYQTYNMTTRALSASTTYPTIDGHAPSVGATFVSTNGKIYGNGASPYKQRIYEFTIDGGGVVQTTGMYAANINFRDITSLYANSLGQREDYLNRLAEYGPERNYWLPDFMDTMTTTQPLVIDVAGVLHFAGWFVPVYNTYPKSIAGPTIFSNLKPFNLTHNPFGVSPETVVVQPDINWDGSNVASLAHNDHGWYPLVTSRKFAINNKFVWVTIGNWANSPDLEIVGNKRVHVFTATP